MDTYRVKRGDTLGKIARRYGIRLRDLLDMNPEITNPNLIRIGQLIDVPIVPPQPHLPGGVQPRGTASAPEPGAESADVVAIEIIRQAKRFVNLYETESNARWDNPNTPHRDDVANVLRDALEASGWQAGWPYCAAFCEAVWRLAYEAAGASEAVLGTIGARLNPGVMPSFKHWNDAGLIDVRPRPGAIFFMQKGRSGKGHAGIVVRVFDGRIATIEGNTSPDPADAAADREGDGIFRRTRTLSMARAPGLWLRGFLNPVLPR